MIRITRSSIIRLMATAIALVGAAACASGAKRPRVLIPVEGCYPSVYDSTGPTPRTPRIDVIPADSGALVGTVVDTRWRAGMAQVVIQLSGRSQERVMTDSLGGFAFRALRPGRYIVRAARLGAEPAEVTTVVRAGRATEVVLRLQIVACTLN